MRNKKVQYYKRVFVIPRLITLVFSTMANKKSILLNRIFQSPLVTDLGILFIRVSVSGLLLMGHGRGKFSQMMELNFQFADPLGIGSMSSLIGAAICEFVLPIFVILGLMTRLACIPIIFTMFVAGVVVHSADPLFPEFMTMGPQNVMTPFKEYALLYGFLYAMILLTGPGRISLDRLFSLDKAFDY